MPIYEPTPIAHLSSWSASRKKEIKGKGRYKPLRKCNAHKHHLKRGRALKEKIVPSGNECITTSINHQDPPRTAALGHSKRPPLSSLSRKHRSFKDECRPREMGGSRGNVIPSTNGYNMTPQSVTPNSKQVSFKSSKDCSGNIATVFDPQKRSKFHINEQNRKVLAGATCNKIPHSGVSEDSAPVSHGRCAHLAHRAITMNRRDSTLKPSKDDINTPTIPRSEKFRSSKRKREAKGEMDCMETAPVRNKTMRLCISEDYVRALCSNKQVVDLTRKLRNVSLREKCVPSHPSYTLNTKKAIKEEDTNNPRSLLIKHTQNANAVSMNNTKHHVAATSCPEKTSQTIAMHTPKEKRNIEGEKGHDSTTATTKKPPLFRVIPISCSENTSRPTSIRTPKEEGKIKESKDYVSASTAISNKDQRLGVSKDYFKRQPFSGHRPPTKHTKNITANSTDRTHPSSPLIQPAKDITYVSTNCSKYTTTVHRPENISRLLREKGFVIIKGVLTRNECKEIISSVWDSMEEITKNMNVPLDRHDPQTWSTLRLQKHTRDVYCHYGLAHTDFIWKLRQNPNILKVFADLFRCRPEELLVSFDGVSMQTPPENDNHQMGWHKNCWYHIEKSLDPSNDHPYRSWVTAKRINPGDHTISLFAGSHLKTFDRFRCKSVSRGEIDVYEPKTLKEMKYYERKHTQIRITCPPGSLVVWDSRILYSDLAPLKSRKKANHRLACHLSYYPRAQVPTFLLEHRVSLFRTRKPLTCRLDDNEESAPFTAWRGLLELEPKPHETELLRSLVGYNPSALSLSPYNRKRPTETQE
nr:MAG: scv136-like protein [Metapenaeus ensis nimavirus]